MEKSEKDNVPVIKTILNALDVLDLLRTSTEPVGVHTAARECNLNVATTFRIFKSLEDKGWAKQLQDGQYVAGKKIGFVTSNNNFFIALRDSSKLIMDAYTERYGIAMNLYVRDGAFCRLIGQSLTKSPINYLPPLNIVLPCYACASGKVLLSELSEIELDTILEMYKRENFTTYTITDKTSLREALIESKNNGFATEINELSIGGSCVSVPVRDLDENIIAALSFSGLMNLTDKEKLTDLVPVLQFASTKITTVLYN